jgi:hypothetical protein
VGARFSAPFHTGPEANPTSNTMGTGSFPGVKRPGLGVDHPPLSSTEVKEILAPTLILSPDRPLRSLIVIRTEISWLPFWF